MRNKAQKTYDLDSEERGISSFFGSFLNQLFHRIDLLQVIPMILLLTIGALFIYGAGQQVGGFAAITFWKRHLMYMSIGFSLWLILSVVDYRWFGPAGAALYLCSIFLLIYVLLFGVQYFGARSWIEFGPVNFQPSEIAKMATLIVCAWVLSMKDADINKIFWMGLIILLVTIPIVLIKMQPDLGTAIVFLPIAGVMAFAARLKWKYIALLLLAAMIVVPSSYYFLKEYQRERIKVFLDPERDPQNRGWNQLQAEIAVGSGGFSGKGFMHGTHNTLGYLPQTVSNSDFIFPVIAEETGFLGSIAIVILYMLLLFSVLRTALLAPDDFGRYLCVGIAVLIFVHSFINIGMSIRLLPVTGLPLPLISYGGTFLVAMMTYLGIVHSVYGHREKKSMLEL